MCSLENGLESILFICLLLAGCSRDSIDRLPVDIPISEIQSSPESTPGDSGLMLIAIATTPAIEAFGLTKQSPSGISSEFEALCRIPVEQYGHVESNGHILSERTLRMLEYAYQLYGGSIDIRGPAITQGHYTSTVALSFGTHAGGGVVDISVIEHSTWEVLYDEIEPLIQALRIAGFAAWLRDFNELTPGSPIHIHAVAIADKELSLAATDQLTGQYGYFRGFNGLPMDDQIPVNDKHGGPIICAWMLDEGYLDMSDDD